MENVYITAKKKELTYFIFGVNEKEAGKLWFSGIEKIKSEAFKYSSSLKQVFFSGELKLIEIGAFKNCEKLEVFGCVEKDVKTDEQDFKNNLKKRKIHIEGIEILQISSGDFQIQTYAFESCSNLHTVILPKCSKLVIEKNAFKGCSSLRTVVAFCDEISFTENPFEDCSEDLVFVCKKKSAAERFARENGYRIVNEK